WAGRGPAPLDSQRVDVGQVPDLPSREAPTASHKKCRRPLRPPASFLISSETCYATAAPLAATAAGAVLFLLPGGRPRRFVVNSDIHDGGRPRRRPRPRANRSRLKIASSIWARSSLNSIRIFETSILY